MIGRVRIWKRDRHYGLIEGEDGTVYFAHEADVVYRMPLNRGQAVAFQPEASPRGPRAVAVQVFEQIGEKP